jgi:hypothetical protein
MRNEITRGILVTLIASLLPAGSPAAQQLKYVGAAGCGNIEVFGWTDDHTEAIVIRADRAQLGLRTGANTVTIAPDRKGLEVVVELYDKPQVQLPAYHCNDIRLPEWDRPSRTAVAISGTLLITLGAPGASKAPNNPPSAYHATVLLRDVVFRRPDGTTVSMTTPVTLKAFVGFVLG